MMGKNFNSLETFIEMSSPSEHTTETDEKSIFLLKENTQFNKCNNLYFFNFKFRQRQYRYSVF